MLKIVEIMFKLNPAVLNRSAILIINLRPAGQARTRMMPEIIVWDSFHEIADDFGSLRSRSNKAHMATENVDELRQLVDPETAEQAANPRDPWVIFAVPSRVAHRLPHPSSCCEISVS